MCRRQDCRWGRVRAEREGPGDGILLWVTQVLSLSYDFTLFFELFSGLVGTGAVLSLFYRRENRGVN